MELTFEPLGKYIHEVDIRNSDLSVTKLMGISIDKCYIPSVANVIGTDLKNYKIIKKRQFACSLMQVSRDQRIPIAMFFSDEPAIMSPAYALFEVNRVGDLLPEYLELWVKRAEFDREASFYAVGGVRGSLDWEDFCNMRLPVPPIAEQRKIVHEYQIIADRIKLLTRINSVIEKMIRIAFDKIILKKNINQEQARSDLKHDLNMFSLRKISDIVDIRDGTHDSPNPTASGYKLITSIHLNPYSVNKETAYSISEEDYISINRRSKVSTGDILMSMIGTVGRLSLVTDDPVDFAIKNMALFKTSELSQGQCLYILSYLKSKIFYDQLYSYIAGSTQVYVSLEVLRSMPIIIPEEKDLSIFLNFVTPLYSSLIGYEKEISVLNQLSPMIFNLNHEKRPSYS